MKTNSICSASYLPLASIMFAFLFIANIFAMSETPKTSDTNEVSPAAGETVTTNAYQRTPLLLRGISISNRFQLLPARTIPDRELKELKELGFTFIRLPVNPTLLNGGTVNSQQDKLLDTLADVVDRATNKYRLAVVIDSHTFGDEHLEGTSEGIAQNKQVWSKLTSRLSKYNSSMVFYELYNEPTKPTWQKHMEKLVNDVRKMAPQNTLIVGGNDWNSMYGLLNLKPITNDKNIVYVFHYYEPFVFTHQGADWIGSMPHLKRLYYVPYPITVSLHQVRMAKFIEAAIANRDKTVTNLLARYASGAQGRSYIENNFAKIKKWSDTHKVPIMVGEFGVLRGNVSPDSRYKWIKDVRQSAEKYHFGWAMWEYDFGFGLKDPTTRGQPGIDPLTAKALGLTIKN